MPKILNEQEVQRFLVAGFANELTMNGLLKEFLGAVMSNEHEKAAGIQYALHAQLDRHCELLQNLGREYLD